MELLALAEGQARRLFFVAAASAAFGLACSSCTKEKKTPQPVVVDEPPESGPTEAAAEPKGPAPTIPGRPAITDETTTEAVKTNLLLDLAVPSHLIDVSTHLGVVELSGYVDNLLAKQRAVELARATRSVRSVVDRIQVRPIKRADADIRRDVEAALKLDPVAEAYEVQVSVDTGVVTLSGEVQSWQEKMLAEDLAKSIKGVREIRNELKIDYELPRKDSEILEDVSQRLESDVFVEEATITVNVENGEVELAGVTGSAAEKQRAIRDSWVPGTKDVDAKGLKVKLAAAREIRRKRPPKSFTERQTKQALEDAFLMDPRIVSERIDIRIQGGVAILSGRVPDLRAKQAATETGLNTVGIYHVRNLLDVRPPTATSDEKLSERVKAALERDPYIKADEMTVTALNGEIFLNGEVKDTFQRKHAESVAARVSGVMEIENNLMITTMPDRKQDWWLKREVEAQLLWDPFVSSRTVSVEVDRGVVTLKGTVRTWLQRRMAERDAWRAGAREVRNELKTGQGPVELRP
jgi:osmotically-inducible protein OsmY